MKRQSYSDSISGSSFLPVIQSLVNPSRDQRKGSRSRSETRQKSVRVASSPLLSDLSVNDATPNLSLYSPFVARITPLSSASATPLAIKSESLTPRSQSDCSEVCPIVGESMQSALPSLQAQPISIESYVEECVYVLTLEACSSPFAVSACSGSHDHSSANG